MWKTKAINRELPPGAGKKKRQRKEEGMAILFLLPSLLGLVLLSLIPMLISLYISLTDWVYTDGLGNWNFVGLQNFVDLWKDSWFQKSLWNTVIFTIVTVPLTIILALVIAALIDNFCADRTAGVVRIALYMPHICNIVATSTIWKTMYSTYGPFTNLMRALGWSDPPRFLVSYTGRFRRLCWLSSGQRLDIPYFCMGQPCSHCLPICTNVHLWTVQTDSKSSGN